MSDCKCLNCKRRFSCDFALSVWAAKARMKDKGIDVKFITYECSNQKTFDDIVDEIIEEYSNLVKNHKTQFRDQDEP